MGGRLSIRADFPDGTTRELNGLVPPPPAATGEKTGVTRQPTVPAANATRVSTKSTGQSEKGSVNPPKPVGFQPTVGTESFGEHLHPPAMSQAKSAGRMARKAPTKGDKAGR